MSLLNFNFVMIYIINKMLALLKNNLNFLRDSISDCFFNECNTFFLNKYFSSHIIMES